MSNLPPGLLVVPALELMYSQAAAALMRLSANLPAGSAVYVAAGDGRSTIAAKRNHAASLLLAQPPAFEWLCMVDSDMTPPPDAVLRLLEAPEGVGVSGALYKGRRPPFKYEAARTLLEGWGAVDPLAPTDRPGHKMHFLSEDEVAGAGRWLDVDAVGFGCVVIRRAVLERLTPPRFVPSRRTPFDWDTGEDFNFCIRARDAGFGVVVDTHLRAGHLGLTTY